MSGHSKFANIKHKKAKNDAQKGKVFTKIGREIAVAVKEGGSDPSVNGKLRDIIAKAKSNNMPNDTIQRSIKKAAGEDGAVNYEYITYEGYGPNGVAVIVETLTDNKNRTAGNVRSAFTKGNGNMGTSGCVSFMFDKKGQIVIEREATDKDEDELMMLAIEAGADDFEAEEEGFTITTAPEAFGEVHAVLENAGIEMAEASVTMVPQTWTTLTSEADIKAFNKMIDLLEDDDDVQEIYHNWDEE
ncbi:YebC/PmpR family DNA-binding transcriptional regulator [Sporanaerobium hydrogeniformans]|uniref:YebC/PmpR family DNA-binding transcriptional regulator n=1 Tax=Sporanaerobium hydrogeniformans TaxID=3072179 RepID=A0AC61DBS4_9FIRM|nr:YebC/PmpR family DNA-binding transcriptional regulator [Sporanaerobium hydrogeniformans]PHV70681.1 YebC/PmpR family DNA-binding transcriptional regulator [Sporanaerobium hydrogeniformans]